MRFALAALLLLACNDQPIDIEPAPAAPVDAAPTAPAAARVVRLHLLRETVPAELDADQVAAALADAVDFWASCGHAVELAEDGAPVSFAAVPAGALATSGGRVTLDVNAPWSTGKGCTVEYLVEDILRHEIGHLVGQYHEPERESVMNAYALACVMRTSSETCSR